MPTPRKSNSDIHSFSTGFTDTQLDLRRSRPQWLSPSDYASPAYLTFPPHILETRHNIVHRHLPPLFVLKKAAQESLDWLWEWYWSRLDSALSFSDPSNPQSESLSKANGNAPSESDTPSKIQTVLKSYLRARKAELKARPSKKKSSSPASAAAQTALSALAPLLTSPKAQKEVLEALIADRYILPATRALSASSASSSTNMAGAFLIWDPLLFQISGIYSSFMSKFVDAVLDVLASTAAVQTVAVKEAFVEWTVHIVSAPAFKERDGGLGEYVLQATLSRAGSWDLRLAERVLRECGDGAGMQTWRAVLDAVKGEAGGEEDVGDVEMGEAEAEAGPTPAVEAAETETEMETEKKDQGQEKLRGPQKYVGLWRPQPIGVLPVGWEVDE